MCRQLILYIDQQMEKKSINTNKIKANLCFLCYFHYYCLPERNIISHIFILSFHRQHIKKVFEQSMRVPVSFFSFFIRCQNQIDVRRKERMTQNGIRRKKTILNIAYFFSRYSFLFSRISFVSRLTITIDDNHRMNSIFLFFGVKHQKQRKISMRREKGGGVFHE